MTSSTHSFAYSIIHIDCSRNVSLKIMEIQNFISSLFSIRFTSNFLCAVRSFFYSFYWCKLNLDGISPLMTTNTWTESLFTLKHTHTHWHLKGCSHMEAKLLWVCECVCTLSVKRNITSSGQRSLKSTASKLIIFVIRISEKHTIFSLQKGENTVWSRKVIFRPIHKIQ